MLRYKEISQIMLEPSDRNGFGTGDKNPRYDAKNHEYDQITEEDVEEANKVCLPTNWVYLRNNGCLPGRHKYDIDVAEANTHRPPSAR